jgi:putative heme-binding domain-containing protein
LTTLFLLASPAFAQRDLKNIPDPDPEEERKTFIVADGFEVTLYAADPLLAKPIQMNFDAQGRLWIASSEVYPQVKPGQKATDKILVLEDKNGDGQADKTTVFADGLLIPTGVIPDDNGGAYVVNSTELLHLQDRDADLKADDSRIVLSGFGTEDTHHLLHTLRWGPDGCLYMNQSIYIHSHVETPYGVKRLNGGGIWRFRPETMELEVLCYGFVNPWGHHIDRWGQSFATDGAYGEGINYVFPGAVFVTAPGATRLVQGLNPGSPKHCGLEIVGGRHLPPEWDGNMITNDFRAHRVCRFVVTEDNSGYASRQEVELIKTTHVAFRPIDVKMGPDGAIYIADWYNPIIQHGEVDFRDERRDHTHGRIWRVTAKGRPTLKTAIPANASIEQLLELLKSPEEWVRQHAKNMLKARDANAVLAALQKWEKALDAKDPNYEHHRLEALWTYECIDIAASPGLLKSLAQSEDARAQAAAVRTAVHWLPKPGSHRPQSWAFPKAVIEAAVKSDHPRVRLEGVRGLAQIPEARSAELAVTVLDKPLDRFLDFALWQTLRDLAPEWLPELKAGTLTFGGNVEHLSFALRAVDSPDAVPPLLKLVQQGKIPAERVDGMLLVAAAFGKADDLGVVLDLILAKDSPLTSTKKAAVLDALVQANRLRKVKPAGDLTRIAPLLGDDGALWSSAARAAGAWKLEPLRSKIESAATSGKLSERQFEAAVESLAAYGGAGAKQSLQTLASSPAHAAQRPVIIAALAAVDLPRAAQQAAALLAESPEGLDPSVAIAPILANKAGPAALTAALASKQLPPDTAKIVLRSVQSSSQPSPELLAAVRKAGGLENAGWKPSPQLMAELVTLAKEKGNASRGELVFRRKEMQCLKCHAIGGAGGVVGPDLVSIGASAQPDYLVESLLEPVKKVKEGYHSLQVLTQDGEVVAGIPVRENKTELVLRNAEDKVITVPKSEIAQRKEGRSLMPDGTVDSLTKDELVDLVRFLSELGKVGDFAVSKARIARRYSVLPWTKEAHHVLNRTSFDSAAGGGPEFTWEPAYSRVSGDLPLTGLPTYEVHKGQPPTTFLRTEIEVTTPGKVQLVVGNPQGVALWVDGKPTSLAEKTTLDLAAGRHALTLAVDRQARNDSVRLELADVPGSACQAQFVGGK